MKPIVAGQERMQRRYFDNLVDRSSMKLVSGPCKQLHPAVRTLMPCIRCNMRNSHTAQTSLALLRCAWLPARLRRCR